MPLVVGTGIGIILSTLSWPGKPRMSCGNSGGRHRYIPYGHRTVYMCVDFVSRPILSSLHIQRRWAGG